MDIILAAPSVFLEARFFADDLVEERLACEGVSEARDGITVHGLDVRHVRALRWTPDYLSFHADGRVQRHPVAPWIELGPSTVMFARRQRP
ncbi:hypothetical protein CNE_1c25700 [Cupriavidus necator N-1]|uniref:Uncharacterized protein n=1 Tax=Cupriavidus necator (strain ATCC 43291 / DSM 13513 / CCUG 52238 / LMG 8453 / N-1) TaxID=1042878 RepID=G0ERS5_CUPNN|nr:hypothetical protein [Cupriavidus necator]AEI77888.1 hypothetical protein CNE_1c25700 [Cupriavidus necator N-1]KAI3606614.1 hypothetical protein D8I24_1650 [Cupriavidus necator H850]MDX6013580.1 hypothetical protein [Cupriavidus necator]